MENELEKYAEDHSSPEDKILHELNRETHLKVLKPRMLSGKTQGQLLKMLSTLLKPKRILEIGTYTGYSAICLAQGLPEDGELITIDKNEELKSMAEKYFEKSGLNNKIHLINGNALEIIPTLSGTFDMVFIDADKKNYTNYYDLLIDRIPIGGYMIADNVLWSGKVLNKNIPAKDLDTLNIIKFNEAITQDKRVENLLLPIRDGLMILKKVKA